MVLWVVGLMSHSGPIELFLIPTSASRLVIQRPHYVLSCQWAGAYKRTLAYVVVAAAFLSRPLPYV